jgi:hypothetical protein
MLEYALSLARDLAYIAGLVAPINTICVQLLHQVMAPYAFNPRTPLFDYLSTRCERVGALD